mgnify:CR=1 FL=1
MQISSFSLLLHNGPARPWLMGFYADAYLKVFGMSGVSYIDRMLIGFEDEMGNGCVGSLSQLYDANPPYEGCLLYTSPSPRDA